jgi:hypothetical protein
MGAVTRTAVPTAVANAFANDYRTAFARSSEAGITAREWAGAILDEAPAWVRRLLELGWRFGLGLDVGRADTPNTVLGMHVTSEDDTCVVCDAQSRLLVARNVFVLDDGRIVWVAMVRFRSRLGRVLWTAATPLHHLMAPWLLGRAGP